MRLFAPAATALAVLAAAAIAPAAAQGAPPWSPPQTAADGASTSSPPALAVGTTGAGLLKNCTPLGLRVAPSPESFEDVKAGQLRGSRWRCCAATVRAVSLSA